jgi:hypothetical protein
MTKFERSGKSIMKAEKRWEEVKSKWDALA